MASLTLGPAFWREALASTPARPGPGPYGPLEPPDANGIMLPKGFTSRVVATGGQPVPGTSYQWHVFSDGAATYATGDGGWILVSNSEAPAEGAGGASAIRFAGDGSVRAAYQILGGTTNNCAGGATPWGTWLSCEEVEPGLVWECDPTGTAAAIRRPALGVFQHEAVCVDPVGARLYLTEDLTDGGFYRFTPAAYPSLAAGTLEIATRAADGRVTWTPVRDPSAATGPLRRQVPGSTQFKRGEGIWYDSGLVYVATTEDDRVYAYDTAVERMDVLYDGKALGDAAPLHGVDNVTVHGPSGDLFVAEDDESLEVCLITPEPEREVAVFLKLTGPQHGRGDRTRSEVTGPAFNPSGNRFYLSSQRAFVSGVIYEITGAFRRIREGRGGGQGGPNRGGQGAARAIRLETRSSVSLATLRRRGLRATLTVDQPGTYVVALTARFTPAWARRGGRRRRRRVGLARVRVHARRGGRVRVRLRLTERGRAALRGRRQPLDATLVATGRARDGSARRATRPVRLKPPRARRSRSPHAV